MSQHSAPANSRKRRSLISLSYSSLWGRHHLPALWPPKSPHPWTLRKPLHSGFSKGSRGHLFPHSLIFLQLGFFSLETEKEEAIKLPDLLHQSPISHLPTFISLNHFVCLPVYRQRNKEIAVVRETVLFSLSGLLCPVHILSSFSHSILSFNKPTSRMATLVFF